MNVLVVYCHPSPDSFNAGVRDRVISTLEAKDHDLQVLDLYASNFDPVMKRDEWERYQEKGQNEKPVTDQLALLQWAEMLVFVYPTWWFGLPAMLKGWFDRVWIPHVTFAMSDDGVPVEGELLNIRKIAVVTTCGASWFISKLIGEPGRKTILRGIKNLCCPSCRTPFSGTLQYGHINTGKSRQISRQG